MCWGCGFGLSCGGWGGSWFDSLEVPLESDYEEELWFEDYDYDECSDSYELSSPSYEFLSLIILSSTSSFTVCICYRYYRLPLSFDESEGRFRWVRIL